MCSCGSFLRRDPITASASGIRPLDRSLLKKPVDGSRISMASGSIFLVAGRSQETVGSSRQTVTCTNPCSQRFARSVRELTDPEWVGYIRRRLGLGDVLGSLCGDCQKT